MYSSEKVLPKSLPLIVAQTQPDRTYRDDMQTVNYFEIGSSELNNETWTDLRYGSVPDCATLRPCQIQPRSNLHVRLNSCLPIWGQHRLRWPFKRHEAGGYYGLKSF